jgi:hypothetical protein
MGKLGCPVGYMDFTEGSRAKFCCLMYPSMALDHSVTSIFHIGHPSWALKPIVISM